MNDQDQHDPGTDLLRYESRAVDLRNAATDSWTDVLEQVADLAVKIANTDFVPESYRGAPGQVAATVLHGREIGFGPMTALATTHSIKGKPSISAEAMRALVLQAGHEIVVVESTSSRVVMKGRRRGSEEWTPVTWTLDDVRKAKITNHNYQTYPRQMLAARCTAELCRLIFPDVIHGLRAAEELVDDFDMVTEIQQPAAPVEPARTTKVQRKRPSKKAAAEPSDDTAEEVAPDVTPPPRKRVDLPSPKTGEPGRTAGAEDPAPLKTSPPSDGGVSDGDEQDGPEENVTVPPSGPSTPRPPAGDESQQGKENPDEPEDGIVDTEIVTGRSSGPKVSPGQRGAIIGHFKRLSVDNRDEYLLITNVLLELEPGTIASTNELRGDEPQRLLKILETLRDRDALDQRLAGQDQLT